LRFLDTPDVTPDARGDTWEGFMQNLVRRVLLGAVCLAAVTAGAADKGQPPAWAYVVNPPAPPRDPNAPKPVPDETPQRVPNSDVALTLAQTRDLYNPPDWHPNDHPPMPEIVGRGRKPGVFACAYCHLPNGQGRPENAGIAGLPAAYIVQQMADFKSGARKSAVPKMVPVAMMVNVAANAHEDDIAVAAEYFAGLRFQPWIKVVESNTAPKTRVGGAMLVALEDGSQEPLGARIIEVPENLTATELRDSKSGFIAYVPKGSIKKGEALALTGNKGKITPCMACHGADLQGLGPVPPLAGRSPSYMVRQLYDMRSGTRAGAWSPLMKNVVAAMSDDDILNVAAYAASRAP
jgi:cytochrome c553